MNVLKTVAYTLGLLLLGSASVMAQTGGVVPVTDYGPLGVGLVIIGAGVGIGWLTRSAVESMARQPEMAANIQTAMIIAAALIEGVSFFALIILGFIL